MGTILVHDKLTRGIALPETVGTWRVHPWTDGPSWHKDLEALETTLGNGPILIHASIQVTRWIVRNAIVLPNLARGVSLPQEALYAHRQNGMLGELALNRHALYAPFSRLAALEGAFDAALGPARFLRPDSPFKPFAGVPIAAGDWAHELASIAALSRPDPDLLCMVAPHQRIAQPEWRFWCVDGNPVAWAPYAFDATPDPHAAPPSELRSLAARAADRLITVDMLMVVDATFDAQGDPRIVEANGFSTSGFYDGMDLHALWTAATTLL